LALCIPVVVVLVLGVLQVALVGRDRLAIELAAREGARAAAVSADPSVAARAAAERVTTLRPLTVAVAVDAGTVTVEVRATATALPLVGAAVHGLELSASATMMLEPP
jgi:TadE-like protein